MVRGQIGSSLTHNTIALVEGLARSLASHVLADLRSPRLVLVRQPDLRRVERADQPLALGARLVELGEEDRHVTPDDD